jgi:predicted TIM-barrel fold metal-dependent hydrolase
VHRGRKGPSIACLQERIGSLGHHGDWARKDSARHAAQVVTLSITCLAAFSLQASISLCAVVMALTTRPIRPDRCVWGSDVPCELWCPKATYSQLLRVFMYEMGLDPESKRWILGETARRLCF